jgi:hypothetical protein
MHATKDSLMVLAVEKTNQKFSQGELHARRDCAAALQRETIEKKALMADRHRQQTDRTSPATSTRTSLQTHTNTTKAFVTYNCIAIVSDWRRNSIQIGSS